jgi:thioredoxin-related protein
MGMNESYDKYLSVSININKYQSVSISINQYQLVSISIYMYNKISSRHFRFQDKQHHQMRYYLLTIFAFLFLTAGIFAQSGTSGSSTSPEVKWYSFEDGMKLAKKQRKFVIVDIFTDWCGWCKRMDNETFRDPRVVSYLNENFVAIKLNAEGKEAIAFNGNIYTNPSPSKPRSTHQLAIALAGSRLAYPTYIYLDSKGNSITATQGYSQPEDLLPLLEYIGSNAYKTKTWKEFTGLK